MTVEGKPRTGTPFREGFGTPWQIPPADPEWAYRSQPTASSLRPLGSSVGVPSSQFLVPPPIPCCPYPAVHYDEPTDLTSRPAIPRIRL